MNRSTWSHRSRRAPRLERSSQQEESEEGGQAAEGIFFTLKILPRSTSSQIYIYLWQSIFRISALGSLIFQRYFPSASSQWNLTRWDIIMSNEHHHYEHDQWSSSSSMNITTLLLHLLAGAARDARAVHAGRAVRRERGNVHLVHSQGCHRHPHPRLSNVCHCSGWYTAAEQTCHVLFFL